MPSTQKGGKSLWERVGFVFFLLTLGCVFASWPNLMSGNFLPKSLWASLALALGYAAWTFRGGRELRLGLTGALWAAYFAWAAISLCWAASPLAGVVRLQALFLPTAACLFALGSGFWRRTAFWYAFCSLVGLVALIGVFQYLPERLVPGAVRQAVNWFTGTAVPRATMGHRNYASLFFSATIPFLAWFYYRTPRRWCWVPLLSLGLAFFFVLVCRTRGVWIGMGCAGVFVAMAGVHRSMLRRFRRTAVLVVLPLAALAVGLVMRPSKQVEKHMQFTKPSIAETAEHMLVVGPRGEMWRDAWHAASPALGSGFGNFPIRMTAFSDDQKVKTLNWEVHNDYLQALVDLGVVGAALFTAFFAVLILVAWRGRGNRLLLAAGAGVVCVAGVQFTSFLSEVVSTQIWLAGMMAIVLAEGAPPIVFRRMVRGWLPLAAKAAVCVYLLACSWQIGRTMEADGAFVRLRGSIAQEQQVREMLKKANSQRPTDAMQLKQAANMLYGQTDGALAVLLAKRIPPLAYDLNMLHIHLHLTAKSVHVLGHVELAQRLATMALRIHPNDHTMMYTLAEIALSKKNFEGARPLLERIVELTGYNPYSPVPEMLASCRSAQGDPTGAAEVARLTEANRLGKPANPVPPLGQKDVPTNIVLDWPDVKTATHYTIVLWKRGAAYGSTANTDVNLSQYRPVTALQTGVEYLWQITAWNQYGKVGGPVWNFWTTSAAEQRSP